MRSEVPDPVSRGNSASTNWFSRASREAGPDGVVAVYGLNKPSVVFYARRLVTVIGKDRPDALADLLARDRACYVITKAAWADRFRDLSSWRVIETRGGYVLATNRPASPPEGVFNGRDP